MIKNLLLLLCLFFFYSIDGSAQHALAGSIKDSSGDPVAFANIILLDGQDSTTVRKGAVSSEDGTFILNQLEKENYLLRISFVGFKDFERRVQVPKVQDIGVVVLKEAASDLGEVTIDYQRPKIIKEVDRIIFRVQNTSLSSGSTWEILKKTPGVLVSDNRLQVKNQSVQVYINDRKVQISASELQTLLQNYSGENIKSVEVITAPPARYDAEGGAILNIVTSKAISPGYKGSIKAAYTQAIYPKYNFGTSHYLKTEDLNLFANYNYAPRKEFKDDDSYINFRNADGEIISRWRTDFDRITESQAHSANLMLDYELNSKNLIYLSSSALYAPDKTFRNLVRTRILDDLSESPDYFTTTSALEEDLANLAVDLEYKRLLEKPDSYLSMKLHYTWFEQDRVQRVMSSNDVTGEVLGQNEFYTEALQDIDIATAQIDYVSPFGNLMFETGLKAAAIQSESRMDFFDIVNQNRHENTTLSDFFTYDERIFAGYLSLARDWKMWSIKAGLRGEYTNRRGDSESMQQVNERKYLELFPTFFLQHSLSAAHVLSFDYSRRIQRPRYESLNPFRYFLNRYDFNAGNPNLRAAISQNFKLSYTFKNQYFFDLYYRDNGGYPQVISFQDNDNFNIRRLSVNLTSSTSYGLDITHGRSLSNWWYAYTYMSFFHEDQSFIALESAGQEVTNEIDAFYGTIFNSFTLSADGTFTGDLTLTYVSDWITGSYNFGSMTTLSFGIRKSLWNERAELSLHVEDALDKTNTWLTSRYLNQDNGFYAKPETRYIRVGFQYNFGNFRLSDNKRAVEAVERERL